MKKYIHLGFFCLFLSIVLPVCSLAAAGGDAPSKSRGTKTKTSRKKPKTRFRQPDPILVLKVPADFPRPQS